MKTKWLNGIEAVETINPLIEKRNRENPLAMPWSLLNDKTSFAVAAFEEEFVIGYICLQLFPFLGPMFVEQIACNGEVSKMLVDEMAKVMADMQARGVMVVCESPVTERMCKARGMKRIEFPVYISTEVGT